MLLCFENLNFKAMKKATIAIISGMENTRTSNTTSVGKRLIAKLPNIRMLIASINNAISANVSTLIVGNDVMLHHTLVAFNPHQKKKIPKFLFIEIVGFLLLRDQPRCNVISHLQQPTADATEPFYIMFI